MKPLGEKTHPATENLPMMSDSDYERLKASIAEVGQSRPIAYFRGLLLDGRNRLRACRELGLEPKIEHLPEDTDPWLYVDSTLENRQMKTSQRAMCAAKRATFQNGEIGNGRVGPQICGPTFTSEPGEIGNGRVGPPKGGPTLTVEPGEIGNGRVGTQICGPTLTIDGRVDGQICTATLTVEQAAKKYKVSQRSVTYAKQVIDNGCEALVKAVHEGEWAINAALALIAKLPGKNDQAALLAKGRKSVRDFLREDKPTPGLVAATVKMVESTVQKQPLTAEELERTCDNTEKECLRMMLKMPADRLTRFLRSLNERFAQVMPEELFEHDPADLKPPAKLATPEFLEAWRMWCRYNVRRNTPLTIEEAQQQFKSLARCKPETAVARIDWSIANRQQTIVLAKQVEKDFEPPTLEQAMGYAKAATRIPSGTVEDWWSYFAESGWKKYNSDKLIDDWQQSLHRWHKRNQEMSGDAKPTIAPFEDTPDPCLEPRRKPDPIIRRADERTDLAKAAS